uniref:Uncharacterized protein n=1 Tax=Aegilops tauschii subsp. strangulata TaxID=200361 RepID=A0A453SPU8_AEGTS
MDNLIQCSVSCCMMLTREISLLAMKASIAYCSWVIVETISIFMIFILSCLGRDPPYQGKSGVVWAREVLVYQVKLLLPLILPLLIMPAALPCLFSPFISFKIFLNVIIVTIVQSSKRNTKGNKMQ